MQKKLIALFLVLSLTLVAFAGVLAEGASQAVKTEVVAGKTSGNADPTEYVPKIVRDHPEAFRKVQLNALDKVHGTVAKYETEDENLPNIDVYVFPKEGVNLRDYAVVHADTCHSKAIQPKKDKNVFFFYDTEIRNGKMYYVLDRMSEVAAERFGEITYYYKTKDIPLGNSGLTVTIPNGFKKGEISEEGKKRNYTDLYDYSDIKKDGTELSSTLKAIGFGTDKLEDGQTFEDYLAKIAKKGTTYVEPTTIARHKFVRLLARAPELGENGMRVIYACEKDGQVNKMCLDFTGNPNGVDTKIISTLGLAGK